jgi:DUF1680 family protein
MTSRGTSRREALAAAGALALSAAPVASLATPSRTPLAELTHADVVLADGPAAAQAAESRRRLLALDEDAVLKPFRERAGQPAPGQDLGGWYGTRAFAPGATFGHWVGALARFHAIDGDVAAGDRTRRLIGLYGQTITEDGRFYQDNRFPAYIYDKLVGALVDAEAFAGETNARTLIRRTTDAALPYLPPAAQPRVEVNYHEGEDFSRHAWDESYTLPENQFRAWRSTGEARHLALAERFLYSDFFSALARGENALPGKHAYSHVNCLSSAARAWLELGSPEHLAAARNGLAMVEAQSFATGGWGPDEHFVAPGSDGLARSLVSQTHSFETPCGAYAHLKLARYLLRITGDSRYGDSAERVLYNTVLGATPIETDGHAFYYSDYTRHAVKTTHPDLWPCCSGTLPLVAADHRLNVAFAGARGLYMNLYLPGEIAFHAAGAAGRLIIATDYPYEEAISLRIEPGTSERFSLYLRIPGWAKGAAVALNAGPALPVRPGAFAEFRRSWRDGDRLTLRLPANPRLEPLDSRAPNTVALMSGPLALMRLLAPGEATPPRFSAADLLAAVPGERAWRVRTKSGEARFRSFMDIGRESYSLYQDLRA